MTKTIGLFFLMILCCCHGAAQHIEKDSAYVDSLFQLGDSMEYELPLEALKLYREAYEVSIANQYDDGAFHAKLYSGLVHSNMGTYDSAFYYLERAEKLVARTKSPLNRAILLLNKANTYHLTGDDGKSVENHLKGLSYLEKTGDSSRLSNAYANLAAVYDQLGLSENQITYFKKAVAVTPKNAFGTKALNHCDLAKSYMEMDSFDLAKSNLVLADSLANFEPKVQILPFHLAANWGEYYRLTKEFKRSIPYYDEALRIGKSLNYRHFTSDILLLLGESHFGLGNLDAAENYCSQALASARELGFLLIQQKAHGYLGKIYRKKGQLGKAYDNIKLYDTLKDSLDFAAHAKQVNQLEVQYQSEKKDREIAQQQLALADQQLAITENKSQTRTMNILIVSLLIGSILLWFSFRQRQKRMQQQLLAVEREQEVRTLESLMEGEEKERLRIAKELHDGVNGDLSAIKFKLVSLLETNNKVINEAVEMIDTSCEQVRAISHNLVPPSLRDFNLLEAVEAYCEKSNAVHAPDISFQHLGEDILLEKKQEANLFRIVQELVSNSIKHADAKEIHVQLSNIENNLQLTVEDDGKGFDPEKVFGKGIGMQNVRSRVDYLDGILDIKSDGQGTSITVTFS